MNNTVFYTVQAAYDMDDILDGFADYNSQCFNTIEEAKEDAKRVKAIYGYATIRKYEAR